MKIAILTSGILPIPAVRGGAVENLIDFYLEYNNLHRLHDITVYSVWHPDEKKLPALKSDVNHYRYIKTDGWWHRLRKYIIRKQQLNGYYHYTIEYFLNEIIKKVKNEHYDLIVIENRPGYILNLERQIKTKYVLHLHNDFLNQDTKCAKEIYNSYHRIINVSEYITNKVNKVGTTCKKGMTVYNAIDTGMFFQAVAIKKYLFELTKDDFIIVYSGRLNKEKGILHLIQAVKTLNNIPNLKLLIIGASNYGKDKHPTPFTIQLEKESEPIKDKVIFTGFINYAEVPSYLKMSDIAVVPSMWEEPFGLTVVEAMAAGIPLITTHSGGIPEICEGIATIVDKENIVENLANAIQDLYDHPEKRKQMAAASLERSKLFDKETYAKKFFAALESI